MATIRRGSTATGALIFGPSQPIALVNLNAPKPPKPEPPKPEPPKPEPPKPEPPKPQPPEPETPVSFPTDPEFNDFSAKLDAKYRDDGLRPAEPTFVDALGRGRWTYDYSLHRQAGLSHQQAWDKVNRAINDIWGIPNP